MIALPAKHKRIRRLSLNTPKMRYYSNVILDDGLMHILYIRVYRKGFAAWPACQGQPKADIPKNKGTLMTINATLQEADVTCMACLVLGDV